MIRLILMLSLLIVTKILAAQATAFANASATILNSVGTEQLTGNERENIALLPSTESISISEKQSTRSAKQGSLAAFRIMGSEFVYSVNVNAGSTPSAFGNGFAKYKTTQVNIVPVAGKKDAYIVADLLKAKPDCGDNYGKRRLAEVIINFN